MIFLITPLRSQGKPLDRQHLRSAPFVRGDLRIEQHESRLLGRITRAAFINTGAPSDMGPLGTLLDVEVHSMAPNAMVVTGLEVIDGVAYGQSWLCRQE